MHPAVLFFTLPNVITCLNRYHLLLIEIYSKTCYRYLGSYYGLIVLDLPFEIALNTIEPLASLDFATLRE